MRFEDLSVYSYDLGVEIRGVRNVGWLDAAHEYARGDVAPAVLDKLKALAVRKSVNQMRGFHYCDMCSIEAVRLELGGRRVQLGSAEIWVPDKTGGFFASPNLIVHYIQAHGYCPPREYLEAVDALAMATWNPPDEIASELRSKQ